MAIARSTMGITSPAKIVANVFISFIGAGLLGLPYAFKESGILEGALIMTIVGYLSVGAMLMLIDCKYAILSSGARSGGRSITMESQTPLIPPDSSEDEEFEHHRSNGSFSDLTYGDIGLYAMGATGKKLVDITIIVSQIGFCCGYLIYLCENLKTYLSGLTQGQWLALLLPPMYGLTLLRHLNKLAIFSLFAQASNVFALAVVFWFDFAHMKEVSFHPKEFSLKGFPFFFAVAIYCYEGAGMILSLEESVAIQKKKMFKPIFVGTMVMLTFLYVIFGASGYISFGPHTQQIITLNLCGKSSIDFAAIVKICLGVSFFFTYPLMLFPVTHLIDKSFGFQNDTTKGNLMRLVLVLLTGIVVIAIPSFTVLAGLIGATCCTFLAFIMPAGFHMIIFKNRLTRRQKYFDILLITLGLLGTIIGLWDTVHRIMDQSGDEMVQTCGRGPSISEKIRTSHIYINEGLNLSTLPQNQIDSFDHKEHINTFNLGKGDNNKINHIDNTEKTPLNNKIDKNIILNHTVSFSDVDRGKKSSPVVSNLNPFKPVEFNDSTTAKYNSDVTINKLSKSGTSENIGPKSTIKNVSPETSIKNV